MVKSKIHTTEYKGRIYPIAYKIVTANLRPLGLRKNPNIITYPINEWLYLSENELIEGIYDLGGIWLARTQGTARKYQKYMKEKQEFSHLL